MATTSASSAGSSLDVETERGADNTFAATTSRHRVPLQLESALPAVGSLARSHVYTPTGRTTKANIHTRKHTPAARKNGEPTNMYVTRYATGDEDDFEPSDCDHRGSSLRRIVQRTQEDP